MHAYIFSSVEELVHDGTRRVFIEIPIVELAQGL